MAKIEKVEKKRYAKINGIFWDVLKVDLNKIYLERAMADFFCTRSAAESSDLEFVPFKEVSNIESKNPTPSIASISCRQLALAAMLAKTVTT